MATEARSGTREIKDANHKVKGAVKKWSEKARTNWSSRGRTAKLRAMDLNPMRRKTACSGSAAFLFQPRARLGHGDELGAGGIANAPSVTGAHLSFP